MNNQKIFIPKTFSILVYYFITLYCFTASADFIIFNYTTVFSVGLFLVIISICLSKKYYTSIVSVNTFALLIYILFLFLIGQFVTDPGNIDTHKPYLKKTIILFVEYGIYQFIRMSKYSFRRKIIYWFLIGITVSSCYTIFVASMAGSDFIRETTRGIKLGQFKYTYGGYHFICMLSIVFIAFASALYNNWNEINGNKRIVIIINLVIIWFTIALSGFMTLLILITISLFLLIPKKKAKIVGVMWLAISISILIPFMDNIFNIFNMLSDVNKQRLLIIFKLSDNNNSDGLYSDRFARMLKSIHVFTNFPIFGGISNVESSSFGRHSEWFDQLARYGIVAFIFNSIFWAKTYYRIRIENFKNIKASRTLKLTFLFFIILGIFENLAIDVVAAPLLLFAPFIDEVIKFKKLKILLVR